MLKLTLHRPAAPPLSFELVRPRTTLGRSARNDIHVDDLFASRLHAELRLEDGACWLTDLDSANGTLVNSRRITGTVQVFPHDQIQIGSTVLAVEAQDAAADGALTATWKMSASQWIRRPPPISSRTSGRITGTAELRTLLSGAPPERVRDARDLLAVLLNVGMALGSTASLDEVLGQILDFIFEGVPAERAFLLLREGDRLVCKAASYRQTAPGEPEPATPPPAREAVEISRTIVREVTEHGRALLTSDAQEDERFRGSDSIVMGGLRSVMAVPLMVEDRGADAPWDRPGERSGERAREDTGGGAGEASGRPVAAAGNLGMIYVDSPIRINVFSEEDLRLLATIASLAAVKIDNARLLDQRLENERLRMQMASAREIQTRLLPRTAPRLPGYDLAGISFPCFGVGGDYYDFIPRGDRRLLIALGDVTGKGMDAALLMSSLHAAVRAHAGALDGGAQELAILTSRLNRYLCDAAPFDRFVTLFCGLLDNERHTLAYTNAGHHPPFLLRRSGELIELEAVGPPAGIEPQAEYAAAALELGAGDLLVIYSDGITDAENPSGEQFTSERLIATARRHRQLDATALRDRIDAELGEFMGSTPAPDDMTLVIVKRDG